MSTVRYFVQDSSLDDKFMSLIAFFMGLKDDGGGENEDGEEPEVLWEEQQSLGGEALVNAVFQKLFPKNFMHALPVRNHKAWPPDILSNRVVTSHSAHLSTSEGRTSAFIRVVWGIQINSLEPSSDVS